MVPEIIRRSLKTPLELKTVKKPGLNRVKAKSSDHFEDLHKLKPLAKFDAKPTSSVGGDRN